MLFARLKAVSYVTFLLPATISFAQTGFTAKTFPAVSLPADSNSKLVAKDLNGDGRPDLVVYGASYHSSTGPQETGYVLLNDGHGGFLAPEVLPSGIGYPAAAQIGDMNGDGYPDIVGCENVSGAVNGQILVIVYLNNGHGSFTALPPVYAGDSCTGLTLGDVYHTGHLAVVAAGSSTAQYNNAGQFVSGNTNYINVFSNDGTGKLTLEETDNPLTDDAASGAAYKGCGIIDVAGGDFLQTGRFDLLLTSDCPAPTQTSPVFPGPAGTTFLAVQSTSTSGSVYPTYTHIDSKSFDFMKGYPIDVNKDGKLDSVFAGLHTNTSANLTYFQNEGNGNFNVNSLMSAYRVYGSGVGDFNGDGFNDLAAGYEQGSATTPGPPMIRILSGSASGTFADTQDFVTGTSSQQGGDVIVADFNGDGRSDIATLLYDPASKATTVNVYINTQGTSTGCTTSTPGAIICSPTAGAMSSSPVTFTAAGMANSGSVNHLELWIDGTKINNYAGSTLDTSVTVASGSHAATVVEVDSTGAYLKSTPVSFSVAATGACAAPTAAGVNVCSPIPGETTSSPVTITASGKGASGTVNHLELWIDGTKINNYSGSTLNTSVALATGSHAATVVEVDSKGAYIKSNPVRFTVK